MNVKFFLIFILLLLSCVSTSTISNRKFICNYSNSISFTLDSVEKEINSKDYIILDSIIQSISSIGYRINDIEIILFKDDNLANVAFAEYDIRSGSKKVFFNKNLIHGLNSNSSSQYSAIMSVIAHEVGHLKFGHTVSNHENERLADNYSGWVMNYLNVPKEFCTIGLERYLKGESVSGTISHPSKLTRIKEVLSGWERGELDHPKIERKEVRFYGKFLNSARNVTGNLVVSCDDFKDKVKLVESSNTIIEIPKTCSEELIIILEDSNYVITEIDKPSAKNSSIIFINVRKTR